jgi:hypothetical protein
VKEDRRQERRNRAAAKAAEARKSLSLQAAAKVPQLLDAARRGHIDALTALLAGPDSPPLDAQDSETLRPPVMEAAATGREAVVEWLLERGVKVKLKDDKGYTARPDARGGAGVGGGGPAAAREESEHQCQGLQWLHGPHARGG